MASDNKIWIMAFFMLASFLFKALKKKWKSEKELDGNQEPEANSSFGFNELLQQFEEKYTAPESEYIDYSEKGITRVDELSLNQAITDVNVSKATEVVELVDREINPVKVSVNNHYDILDDEKQIDEINLEQMVIASAILDRPSY